MHMFVAVACCVSPRSDAVIRWVAKLLPQSLFVIYEQIHPHDPFGHIMQDHFLKLNSTLHALRQYPDAAAQRHRFLDKASVQTLFSVLQTLRVMDTLVLSFLCSTHKCLIRYGVSVLRAGSGVCAWI